MKLWAMPRRATQDGQVMAESSHKTTSVFFPWEPHEQDEKAKRDDTERWTPQVSRCQYATGEEWRNNSRKNEEMEPKQNNTQLWIWLEMEVKSNAVKSNTA